MDNKYNHFAKEIGIFYSKDNVGWVLQTIFEFLKRTPKEAIRVFDSIEICGSYCIGLIDGTFIHFIRVGGVDDMKYRYRLSEAYIHKGIDCRTYKENIRPMITNAPYSAIMVEKRDDFHSGVRADEWYGVSDNEE